MYLLIMNWKQNKNEWGMGPNVERVNQCLLQWRILILKEVCNAYILYKKIFYIVVPIVQRMASAIQDIILVTLDVIVLYPITGLDWITMIIASNLD